ncbi:hypothetical protein P886_1710 [Alteromonadaceae bacterium 2753L.S.0a.02]|nr:hypothetical protein P886_1710 [Alteromonadaceae bacterium 2753L.S.0a.02]
MAIVIQEVEAEVSAAEPSRNETQAEQSPQPGKRETAQKIERELSVIQRRNERLMAD